MVVVGKVVLSDDVPMAGLTLSWIQDMMAWSDALRRNARNLISSRFGIRRGRSISRTYNQHSTKSFVPLPVPLFNSDMTVPTELEATNWPWMVRPLEFL